MNKNKVIGIIAWVLGLALANLLLFCLEQGMTASFWITFGFVWAAFVSSFIFQTIAWKKTKDSDGLWIHIPTIYISYVYMAIQIPICIIFALCSLVVSAKVVVLINGTLLILAWLLILGTFAGNDYIQKVNSRQKNNHIEL